MNSNEFLSEAIKSAAHAHRGTTERGIPGGPGFVGIASVFREAHWDSGHVGHTSWIALQMVAGVPTFLYVSGNEGYPGNAPFADLDRDEGACEEFLAWYRAELAAQESAEREERYKHQCHRAATETRRGAPVLCFKGKHRGKAGKLFWAGSNQFGDSVGIDSGGPRNAKGWCAEPTFTSPTNVCAIPEELAVSLTGDLHGLLVVLCPGEYQWQVYRSLLALASEERLLARLEALELDYARASVEYDAVKNAKGKGSTLVKRNAQNALDGVVAHAKSLLAG